jgi:hypothetical protein
VFSLLPFLTKSVMAIALHLQLGHRYPSYPRQNPRRPHENRTWMPRPVGGEEKSSRRRRGGVKRLAWQSNVPAMRSTIRSIIWCGRPRIGSGSYAETSDNGARNCSTRLPRTSALRLTPGSGGGPRAALLGFPPALLDCEGGGECEEYFGQLGVRRVPRD